MNKIKYFIFFLSILLLAACPILIFGQDIGEGIEAPDFERLGQTGWQFLKIPTNARQAGMGGIVTVMSPGDASAALTNPAAMTAIDNWNLAASKMNWIADISFNAVAAAKSFGNWGNFGLTFIYVDYGDMIRNENREIFDNGRSTGLSEIVTDLGTFTAHDLSLGISYAKKITTQLQVGGNISYIQEKMDDVSTSNWAVNVGTIYYTGLKSFRLAMVGRNFGPDAEFAAWDERIGVPPAKVRMPMSFSLGAAIDIIEGKDDNPHLLTLAGEFVHPNDGPEKINIGTEYAFNNFLMLRGGYRYNYDEEGITLGGGLNVRTSAWSFMLNYSYWNFGVLGSINMFSIGLGM